MKKYYKDFKLFYLNIIILMVIQLISILLEFIHEKYYLSEQFNYNYSLFLSKIQSDISYIFVFMLLLTFIYIITNTFSSYFLEYAKKYIIYFVVHYCFVFICIQLFGLYNNAFNGAECIPGAVIVLMIYTSVLSLIKRQECF